ncbi:hypothetical protein [Nitrospina gracilis]|uniref:hypothetical protein n=1 Tax=Nitrospina gracilis TaxID=35801 RepID=UPI001F263E51|nr:hypothetical protein [Nitrospina gracilis]MCF8721785.1 hypothetical protein [Nitrospina gracilis Nb-211]
MDDAPGWARTAPALHTKRNAAIAKNRMPFWIFKFMTDSFRFKNKQWFIKKYTDWYIFTFNPYMPAFLFFLHKNS